MLLLRRPDQHFHQALIDVGHTIQFGEVSLPVRLFEHTPPLDRKIQRVLQTLERMADILWTRATIRHPWPDLRFAVKHPRQEPDESTSKSGSVRGCRVTGSCRDWWKGLGNDPFCPSLREM